MLKNSIIIPIKELKQLNSALTPFLIKQEKQIREMNKSFKLMAEPMEKVSKIFSAIQSEHEKNFGKIIDAKREEFLLQNGWMLSPYLFGKDIQKQLNSTAILKKKNREINAIYKNFFCNSNYQELETMVCDWKRNKYFKPRQKIFLDCVEILKVSKTRKRINPSTIILPVLIAQIDGITFEYAKSKGLTMNKLRPENKSGEKIDNFKWIWELPCRDIPNMNALRMLQEFLFSRALPSGQKDPKKNSETPNKVKLRPFFKFSRHKIMHGENYEYGNIDNVLRTFLILDFLSYLE